MASNNAATYADCVSSLRASLNFLESSVEILDHGVSDFPRLVNVLKTVRADQRGRAHQHYELIPQSTLAAAEASLRDEIAPHIALLLSRADSQIERQDRRIETLKARSELQQGRLAADDDGTSSAKDKAKKSRRGRQLSSEGKLRARAVRQRKEALRYGVERLELEVLQKERELRRRLEGQ
ncbi:DASH complex subunit-like protein [Hapsidospora chrysogenum ATCC 11550]|uniref:DASH complex subunit SPC19 n=1 Tax=Hapsidospora chrysogenum (strain ATCC 11550 / CBS 779.69 / DSM 880 / IAM 14645 / JCM 23072 / IMI 49137) TaxID=857340 RepID=A0A086SYM8_HAPC1|nr:DASH complex subunit-like protein [Hapsidospora chrysogenum ATCC 11550]